MRNRRRRLFVYSSIARPSRSATLCSVIQPVEASSERSAPVGSSPRAHAASDDVSARPLAAGSISLGLYVHDLAPPDAVRTMIDQGVLAATSGFDGVTLSEHHAGYPTYLPNPLLSASWLLEAMPRGWSGPFPLLVPLRAPGLVVEELAWLEARHPGRVVAAFASGYVEKDFVACGVPFEDRNVRFRRSLDVIGRELSEPSEVFADDRVVRAAAAASIPMVVAAKGPLAVERAARLGMGLSVPAHEPDELAAVHDHYVAAGGTGPRVLMRWAWLGDLPTEAVRRWDEEHAHSIDGGPRTNDSSLRVVCAPDPAGLADQLVGEMTASKSTALSVRIHLPSVEPDLVAEQIAEIGREVVPKVRAALTQG